MCNKDQTQHFLFENFDLRGQLVGLEESYQQALNNHTYPTPIQKLIGEFMVASLLLSTTIKSSGTLSIQAQGNGDLSLIMAECHNKSEVRAIARWDAEYCKDDLLKLLGTARLVITIDSDEGQRYQGIVPLTGTNLSECLEAYFEQSEQLKTRVWLNAEPSTGAAGMLLQSLPESTSSISTSIDCADSWDRICHLTDTMTHQELIHLENENILYRLYHEELLRMFTPTPIQFKCTCDQDRTLQAIISLGKDEVEDIFAERGTLEAKCEFCNKTYNFNYVDVEPYFMEQEIRDLANDLDPIRTLH